MKRFDTHVDAAEWYRAKGLPLPSNCMVRGNDPLGVEHTAHPKRDLREWDLGYWARTRKTGTFLACKAHYLELCVPPVVTEEQLVGVFGKVPATRNPPAITKEQFSRLLALGRRGS